MNLVINVLILRHATDIFLFERYWKRKILSKLDQGLF